MKLYSAPLSMFGAKTEIAAREKQISFDLEFVPFSLSTFYEPNIIIAPKHEAIRAAGPEQYGVKRDDLSCETRCGRNVVYTWEEAKKTKHPLMKDGFKFIFHTPKYRHGSHTTPIDHARLPPTPPGPLRSTRLGCAEPTALVTLVSIRQWLDVNAARRHFLARLRNPLYRLTLAWNLLCFCVVEPHHWTHLPRA